MSDPGDGAEKAARFSATDLRKQAQDMGALALATLAGIMSGEGSDSVKLAAAREVLDRAHGKPKSVGPKAKAKATKAPGTGGMTVIVKRFTDVTAEDEAEADETEARF
jgi:hypothetical protein